MTELRTVADEPVRVGVVGCGTVADYGHIPAIARSRRAELVGFADPDASRRQVQADKYGLPAFASFEQLADAVELDAVSICTHPDVKLEMIRTAADRGLHAFCEKPLTDTVAQAEQLVETMAAAGLLVGVAFVYRGKPVVQRMMELVREGAIGRLRAVHLENFWDYHGLRDDVGRPGRRRRALANLGTLDCGVHHLDLARYLSGGEFGEISAIGEIVEPENPYPDHLVVQSRMSSGVLVTVSESGVWGYTAAERPVYDQSYRLLGDRGVLKAEFGNWSGGQKTTELHVISGEKQWTENVGAGKAWDQTYEQFFLAITGRAAEHAFLATGRDALTNMRVAGEVIARSTAAGGK